MVLTPAQLRQRGRLALARLQLPTPPPLEPTITDGTAREQRIQEDLSKVAAEREVEQSRFDDLQQRLLEPDLTSSERNEIDNRISQSRRLLIQLSKAKANITAGFTFESSVSRATQVAVAETKRIETLREIERRTIDVVEDPSASQLRTFKEIGLDPIFTNGILTGFSDRIKKVEFPVENLGFFLGESRLSRLETAGLVTITEPKITPIKPPPTEPPTFFQRITAPLTAKEEKAREREKRILETPNEELTNFERFEKFLLERRGKGELPFGLQEIIELKPEVVKGEKFTIFTPLNFFARQITESKIGQAGIKTLEKESPAFRDLVKVVEVTGTGKSVVEFLTIAQLAIFFDPLIRSGTASEQQLIKKKLSQNRFNEFDIDDVLNDLSFKQKGKVIRSKNFGEKVDDAQRMFDKIKETKDIKLRQKQIGEFKKLMKSAHGEKEANRVLNELLSRERIDIGLELQVRRPSDIRGADIPIGLEPAFREKPPFQPEAFREVAKGSPLNQERVSQALAKNQNRIQNARLPLGERFKNAQKLTPRERQATQLKTAQKNRQAQVLLSRQRTKQAQKQRQAQVTAQRQVSRQKLRLLFVPRQTLVQRARLRQRERLRLRERIPRPKKGIPFFIPLPKAKPKKKVKKIPKEITGNFDVFSKKRGKVIRINPKPFKTRSGAKDFGASHVSKTLRASFFVKPTGRVGAKKIQPKLEGFFKRNVNQFRRSKVDKTIFVEKKGFRLDQKSETAAIQKAKKLKLKSSPMIKLKKRNKK